jgi:hypothetical protein
MGGVLVKLRNYFNNRFIPERSVVCCSLLTLRGLFGWGLVKGLKLHMFA